MSALAPAPGRPQPWVLLRGLTREAAHWGDFPQRLGARLGHGHQVLALDTPGNGRHWRQGSPGRVEAMAQACQAELGATGRPVWLVAMSLGAMVALAWAQRAPADVAGCVLINTSLRGVSPFWQRLRPVNYPVLLGLLWPALSVQRRERVVLRLTSGRPVAHDDLPARWAAIAHQRPVSAANALRQLLAAARFTAPAAAPPVPVHLLASAGDRLVAPACSRALAQRWQLPLAVHPWAGHDLPLDDPDWVVERLVALAAPLADCDNNRYK